MPPAIANLNTANALVHQYFVHSHLLTPPLRPLVEDDLHYGGYGFHYTASDHTLRVRVSWGRIIEGATPREQANVDKSEAALDDPKIGGMYDKNGGTLLHDRKAGNEFLVKTYDLNKQTTAGFLADVDRLRLVADAWLHPWASHIALQAQGIEPAPKQLVTLENNPYSN